MIGFEENLRLIESVFYLSNCICLGAYIASFLPYRVSDSRCF